MLKIESARVQSLAPYTRKRFPAFLYCLLFSRESRTTSSLLETIQKRRKTFPCVRSLYESSLTVFKRLTPARVNPGGVTINCEKYIEGF